MLKLGQLPQEQLKHRTTIWSYSNPLKTLIYTCQDISSATISKFKNHAWYLSDDLIELALFDDNVLLLTKNNLVPVMKTRNRLNSSPKRVTNSSQTFDDSTTLTDFATKRSGNFFLANFIFQMVFWKLVHLNGKPMCNIRKQRQ